MRIALFFFCSVMLCTIRYWVMTDDWDGSWVFGLNYAAANGLQMGRDVLYTYGPLGYLAIPLDLGGNLEKALAFQAVLGIVMIAILADLIFKGRFHIANLAIFSALLPICGLLFWFNRSGLENVLLTGVLICFVMARRRGGLLRLLTALVLIGVMTMIKFTSGIMGMGALIGYLSGRVIQQGRAARREVVISAFVPIAVVAVIAAFTLPSWAAFAGFVRGTLEISSGYSSAMSAVGPLGDFTSVLVLVLLIGILLTVQAFYDGSTALFLGLLLVIPLAVSFKHGFVRQDQHVVIFFCFAFLATAFLLLHMEKRRFVLLLAAGPLVWIWQEQIFKQVGEDYAWRIAKGEVAWDLVSRALDLETLHAQLASGFDVVYNGNSTIPEQVRDVIGDSTVSILQPVFSRAAFAGRFNLVSYPLIQKFAAYTPYLDGISARWLREKKPRYIVTDGKSIDGRNAFAEAPATSTEMYRWYDTRMLRESTLLLERRAKPRFERLTVFSHFSLPFNSTLEMPASMEPVFWKMHCTMNARGKVTSLLFRMPVSLIEVKALDSSKFFRILPNLFDVPTLGSSLPVDLQEWSALFNPANPPKQSVSKLVFTSPMEQYYNPKCDVELLHPTN